MPTKANVKLPPSPANIRIVDENGLPTIYFTRFLVDIMRGVGVVDANGDGITEALAKLGLKVDQNILDIQAVDVKADANTADIATHAGEIDANALDIGQQAIAISDNTSDITTNASAISTNASAISAVDARVTGYHP